MRHKNRLGFTPIEVVIAMAILMIGVMGAFRLFPVAMRQVRVSQELNAVADLVETKLSQVQSTGGRAFMENESAILADGFQEGKDAAQAGPDSGIREGFGTTVQRMPGASATFLQRVTISVNLPDGRQERFVTYVAEP